MQKAKIVLIWKNKTNPVWFNILATQIELLLGGVCFLKKTYALIVIP